IQERELKSKRPRAFYYRLPSLDVCDELYYRSLVFGLPFLSAGILTGFVWASQTWKGPWELDPKIVASLVTWLIYLTLFSTRLSGSWRGRRAAYVAVSNLVRRDGIAEGLILSTCNRVEVTANAEEGADGEPLLRQFLLDYHHCDLSPWEPYFYWRRQEEVVRHLFRVASSLDSMIL